MKKFILFAGLGCFAFYAFTLYFKSEMPTFSNQSSNGAVNGETNWKRGVASDSASDSTNHKGVKEWIDSQRQQNGRNDQASNGKASDSSISNDENTGLDKPKYYKVAIKDKYATPPQSVMDELEKQEKLMKDKMLKAQVEGDALVMCNSRSMNCLGGSNEAKTCVTQLRDCDESSSPKKLTDDDLVNVIGRKSFEKYRNHLEFLEKTGSSIRAPGSLEKF